MQVSLMKEEDVIFHYSEVNLEIKYYNNNNLGNKIATPVPQDQHKAILHKQLLKLIKDCIYRSRQLNRSSTTHNTNNIRRENIFCFLCFSYNCESQVHLVGLIWPPYFYSQLTLQLSFFFVFFLFKADGTRLIGSTALLKIFKWETISATNSCSSCNVVIHFLCV